MSTHDMTFAGARADATQQIVDNGFSTELWIPEFGWSATEAANLEEAHPPQLLAAYQCFLALFVAPLRRPWVHLAAEMQAGKTGVMTTLIRLILTNKALRITPQRIFVLTGMSDEAWKKQTRERLPEHLHANVHHNSGMKKVAEALIRLRGEGHLSNVLIILDESHIATGSRNLPNQVYSTLRELCPMDQWQEKNIRFLTISATDPAKVLAIQDAATPIACQVVRLQTSDAYQSVESLHAAGRVRYVEHYGTLHTPAAIQELQRSIASRYSIPKYHLMRTNRGKQEDVRQKLLAAFPGCQVITWDSESKGTTSREDGSTVSFQDVNELLSEEPIAHTFILLKNMFYAAKTMVDTHVGILYDRASSKDDTNLQSLLGRACGYGKSTETIVYTSKQTVDNYLGYWKELCQSNKCPPSLSQVPVSKLAKLDKRMGKVRVVRLADGTGGFHIPSSIVSPIGGAAMGGGGGTPLSTRETANEADFTSEWREFPSFEAAKAWGKHIRQPDQVNGFYQCSTTGKAKTLRYTEVMNMQGGKKTANLPWGKLKDNKSVYRLYVSYRDEHDAATAIFTVRKLTRLHGNP